MPSGMSPLLPSARRGGPLHAMSDSREWVSAARSTLGACRQRSTPPRFLRRMSTARSAASRSSATARPSSRSPSSATARSPDDELPERSDPILDRAVAQLEEYFAGHRRDFDLPLSLAGTAFQLAVWEQLVELDWGEVVSYGELGHGDRAGDGRPRGRRRGRAPTRSRSSCRATGCSAATAASPATAAARASRPSRGCSQHEGIAHIASGVGSPATTPDETQPLDRRRSASRRELARSSATTAGRAAPGSAPTPSTQRYHDEEWGTPLHGDRAAVREAQPRGVPGRAVVDHDPAPAADVPRRRSRGFDIDAVAAFDERDVERLMNDPGIIRNRAKVEATISNARVTQELVARASRRARRTALELRAAAPRPRAGLVRRPARRRPPSRPPLSKALKKLGYRFVGPTTIYALMQSAGMVDDHVAGCFRSSFVLITLGRRRPAPPNPARGGGYPAAAMQFRLVALLGAAEQERTRRTGRKIASTTQLLSLRNAMTRAMRSRSRGRR